MKSSRSCPAYAGSINCHKMQKITFILSQREQPHAWEQGQGCGRALGQPHGWFGGAMGGTQLTSRGGLLQK